MNEEKEMNDEFVQATKSLERQEIEAATAQCDDVYWWKKRLTILGWVVYAIAGFMWIVQDNDRGLLLMLMACALLLFSSTVLHYKLMKRRMVLLNLVHAYKRKMAVPLYHDMLEKFSDQPHLHIHLAEDGTIQITDRSQKEARK